MPKDLIIAGRPFPVQEGDTPEIIKDILVNKHGVSITPEMESAINSYFAPQKEFGSEMMSEPSTPKQKTMADFTPSEYLLNLDLKRRATDPRVKNYGNLESAFQNQLKLEMKQQGISTKETPAIPASIAEKQKAKEGTIKDIANLMKILPEIGTYSGAMSRPAAWVEETGAEWGQNPELAQYLQKIEQLKIPVIKQIQGDVGAVSDVQEKSAKEYFPYKPETLFEENGRPRAIVNLLSSIKAGSGIDLTEYMTPEDIQNAAQKDPEGVLKNYLDSILSKGTGQSTAAPSQTLKPTHRFNPQTGQLEEIQ